MSRYRRGQTKNGRNKERKKERKQERKKKKVTTTFCE
jgi:hypothetical protein